MCKNQSGRRVWKESLGPPGAQPALRRPAAALGLSVLMRAVEKGLDSEPGAVAGVRWAHRSVSPVVSSPHPAGLSGDEVLCASAPVLLTSGHRPLCQSQQRLLCFRGLSWTA